jgi:hypothetical protein
MVLVSSVLIFILSIGQIVINLVKTLKVKDFVDYLVYHGALEKFMSGQNPYHFLYGQLSDKIPFNYPPSSLIALLPFHFLPIKAGEVLLTILSFTSLCLVIWLVIKLCKVKVSLPIFLVICAFFIQTFPVKFTLILGQVNLIVLALTFLSLYFYITHTYKHSYLLAIILLGLASSLKIFPLLLLPLFLLKKDYKFTFSVLGLFLILNLIPYPKLFGEYFFNIFPKLAVGGSSPNFYDQSIYAFLFRLTSNTIISKYLTGGLVLALFLNVLRISKKHDLVFSASYILALFSIGNSFSWQHHLVFAYPLILILLLKNIQKNKYSLIRLVSFLVIWIIMVLHFPDEASPLLLNPFLASYQTIIILVLLFYSAMKFKS